MPVPPRVHDLPGSVPRRISLDRPAADLVDRLTSLAVRGLSAMYQPAGRSFPHTARQPASGRPLRLEGMNVRYSAIAALGLAQLPHESQKQALAGEHAHDLLPVAVGIALAGRDPGAVALALWAAAEVQPDGDGPAPADDVRGEPTRVQRALDRLVSTARAATPIPVVDLAWTLTALVAAAGRALRDAASGAGEGSPYLAAAGQVAEAAQLTATRLMTVQGPGGLFPHHVPPGELSRFRAHVGCFADQVYPIQALARYAAATGDAAALRAADRCAERICALQGPAGQWWWHYDARDGSVVEGYPVYSVHQHGMAPMALLELREAGGADRSAEVLRGLSWVVEHPESGAGLVDDELGVVWRKIGRHERGKVVRRLRSAGTALRPGLRAAALDHLFPPGPVDHECRPYELGWLLYAWHGSGVDGPGEDPSPG